MDPLVLRDSATRTLQLTGSTTLLPRMQRAAERYMARYADRIVINAGCGTARGYKALLDGTTDIAMASGAAPDAVTAAVHAQGLALRATIVAQDAIVPVVHASNPVMQLSLQQLTNIYTGRIVNWRQLGGPDAAIDVLLGPPSGGVAGSWRRCVLAATDTFTPQAQVLALDARLAHLAAHPHAIAYVASDALPARRVKALRVDGSAAAALRAPMLLVTLGRTDPAAARFIAWTARSGAAFPREPAHE